MRFEENIPVLLTVGFFAVMLIFGGATVRLWVKNKWNRTAYIFIILHCILLLSIYLYSAYAFGEQLQILITSSGSKPVLITAGLWSLCMGSLLVSVVVFTRLSEKRYYSEPGTKQTEKYPLK